MRSSRYDVGQQSEAQALRYLRRRGLRLLERNYRCRQGEIDLIMRDGDVVVFIEVRYRGSRQFGGAAASVTHAKQQRIITAAQHCLAVNPSMAERACRFDVVAIEPAADGASRIEWLRDAFRAEDARRSGHRAG